MILKQEINGGIQSNLSDPRVPGARTRDAIFEYLDPWLDRKYGGLTYRMSQIMTGHGCFSSFLFRIKRIDTPICFHCGTGIDSAEHTLEECPAWITERIALRDNIGQQISLKHIVKEIVKSPESWTAFRSFAENVMCKKEEAERERERNGIGAIHVNQRPDSEVGSDD